MNQKTWKILAIIFISVFILETAAVIFLYKVGAQEVNNESICAYDICQLDNDNTLYDSYAYSYGTCQCYINHEVKLVKEIGW